MNSATEALREAVLTDARARAYEITQAALKSAQEIAEKVEGVIAAGRAETLARAETETKRRRQQVIAEADAQVRQEQLAVRETLIGEVVDAARTKLAELWAAPKTGRALMLALAVEGAQAISGEAVRLVVRGADRAWVDKAFLDALGRASGKRAELAPEPIDAAIGGVLVTSIDGRERYDNTLENRLARQLAEIRAAIWARMSHAG